MTMGQEKVDAVIIFDRVEDETLNDGDHMPVLHPQPDVA